MSWIAVAGVAVSAYGAHANKKAGEKASDAQVAGQQAGIDEQRRQFDLTRQDQMPWMDAGRGALGQLSALNSGDYSGFNNAPDYLWARDQGLQGLERGAAARGGMYSGGADADRMTFASGLASQNLGAYRGSLQSMAGLGQSTASSLGQMGMQMGRGIAGAYGNMADARSSSIYNNANQTNNLLGQGMGALGQWYGQNSARNGGGTGWYLGNNPGKG